ncbi:ABC transporter substrate-binding protein [Diaphorobacter ruginosibacter]|uniref:ABC transporter substrate-binding protein n=1 Tax=Diaphorobacter ruginosibacter TaxID=1715720 RepID=A0A7G9RRA5_9BURK|nr:ABC transporter substrate-binding protein [Diaphorobacter ruginosibacter]QNN58130.1 ABC transporter substrate-binding protein [Diaphorobacter ruginosibacter]
MLMNRRLFTQSAAAVVSLALLSSPSAWAAGEAPDDMIKRLSNEVLDTIRNDPSIKSGDVDKIMVLVDRMLMPHVNFRRMTAAAVGPGWRKATPEQQKRLQDEFKILLVRTYSGALSQVTNQSVEVKPMRAAAGDKDVLVRTEVRGKGDPVQVDYRLEQDGNSWKIYNLNVLGVWIVDTYRTQFAQEVNAKGIDGLIDTLVARNKANAASAAK